MKLHTCCINQYVLALEGAQLHQSQYYDTTLPLLLRFLTEDAEEMIKAVASFPFDVKGLPEVTVALCFPPG